MKISNKILDLSKKTRVAFHNFFLDAAFQKFCMIALMILVPAGFGVLVCSTIITSGFSIFTNFIEDFGSLNYTSIPLLFDVIVIVFAFLLIAPILLFERYLVPFPEVASSNSSPYSSRIRAHLGSFTIYSFFVGLVGMVGTGYFSVDRNILFIDGWGPATHLLSLFAFIAFIMGFFFAGIIILTTRTIFPKKLGAFMLVPSLLAILAICVTGVFVTWPLTIFPFISYSLCSWLLVLSFSVGFAAVFRILIRELSRK